MAALQTVAREFEYRPSLLSYVVSPTSSWRMLRLVATAFLQSFIHSSHHHPTLRVYNLNTVMCIPIARQRLGKHIHAKRTPATEGRPLLGNVQVNTPP
jgi:hypothetical protein